VLKTCIHAFFVMVTSCTCPSMLLLLLLLLSIVVLRQSA
jgi:hypothetical protein